MIGVLPAASLNVTRRLGLKTDCHHNFGYYSRKTLIPRGVFQHMFGSRYALRRKLVHI
jgi:hypothetical protein